MRTTEDVNKQVRDSAPLLDRLHEAEKRIGRMCAQRRGPKMSIPVEWSDDDIFICTTIRDAIGKLHQQEAREARETQKAMITLTDEERKKFAAFLMAEKEASEGLIRQLAKLPGPGAIAVRYHAEVLAFQVVIAYLTRETEL